MKKSAFKEFFSEPVLFDDPQVYVVDADGLWTEDSIVAKFCDYFEDWNWVVEDKMANLKNLIRTTHKHAWVKWHAGINEDGEPRNMWWLYYDFTPGRKGMMPVYVFTWNKHFVETGHKFQCQIDENGRSSWSRDCSICVKFKELSEKT